MRTTRGPKYQPELGEHNKDEIWVIFVLRIGPGSPLLSPKMRTPLNFTRTTLATVKECRNNEIDETRGVADSYLVQLSKVARVKAFVVSKVRVR
jgi:hypothetical protein